MTLATNRVQSLLQELSLNTLVAALKNNLAPGPNAESSSARQTYRAVIEEARRGETNLEKWFLRWQEAYQQGKISRIPDVEGELAAKEFAEVLLVKLAPTWGNKMLTEIVQAEAWNTPPHTLEMLGTAFSSLIYENSLRAKGSRKFPGIFSTWGARASSPPPSRPQSPGGLKKTLGDVDNKNEES